MSTHRWDAIVKLVSGHGDGCYGDNGYSRALSRTGSQHESSQLKPRPHQQQRSSLLLKGNNVERVYRKMSSFRQSRMLL